VVGVEVEHEVSPLPSLLVHRVRIRVLEIRRREVDVPGCLGGEVVAEVSEVQKRLVANHRRPPADHGMCPHSRSSAAGGRSGGAAR
jgi:hypothetical protein